MTVEFKELGLTKNESKAYEALVKHGKSGAAKVSKESGVPYSRIYDILETLIRKGLVKVIPEKTKQFVATDPDNLLKLLAKKQNKLSAMAEEIKELKKFYELKVKEPVILAYGKKNFYVIERELKRPEKYSYRIKYASEYRPLWIREAKEQLKKGIQIKDLVRYDEETKKNVDKWLKIYPTIRKFPNEGIAMGIKDDQEVMISLIKSNLTMLIRDAPFCKIMKQLFLAAYEKSEFVKS